MPALNKVQIIGNLCQDPEKRITPNGNAVVSVSLATNETYKDKQGQKQQSTEYHRLVFWGRQAEIVEQYCRKGSLLYIDGKLQTRKWQNKDGADQYTTEIQVRELQMLDSKKQDSQQGQYNKPQQQQNDPYQTPPPNSDFIEDDFPF